MDETYMYWLAAFQYMIGKKKYSQVALVGRIKDASPNTRISKGHLNAVYKERTGRDNKPIKAGLDLQEAIAKSYGYSYLEFINLGQSLLEGPDLHRKKNITDFHQGIPEIKPLFREWTSDDLSQVDSAEFDAIIEEYSSTVQEGFAKYANYICNRIKTVAKNRNQLDTERKQLQKLIEASSDAIKVNRASDKVVLYENQAYKRLVGRSLLWQPCPGLCGENSDDCYVDEVKIKGSMVTKIAEWGGRWFEIVADPIYIDGLIDSVVAVIRDITPHYSKAIEAANAKSRLKSLMQFTSDTVNFFDENKKMVCSTHHHAIDGIDRPTDLYSFILYAGHLFNGVTEAYEKMTAIYSNHAKFEFETTHKITNRLWKIKATPVFREDKFIGIMVISKEASMNQS